MNLSDQIEYRKVSGSATTTAQSFYSNKNVNVVSGETVVDLIQTPQYITYGGTENYYAQDPYAIFTNLNIPFIRFIFTANTFSISGQTEFIHEMYKLDYETYKNYSTSFSKIKTDRSNISNEMFERQVITENGIRKVIETTKYTSGTTQDEKLDNFGITTFQQIQNLLENPYFEKVVNSSSLTYPTYDFVPGQYIKTSGTTAGNYKQELYEDKSQYFIKSYFRYRIPTQENETEILKIFKSSDSSSPELYSQAEFYPTDFAGFLPNQKQISSGYTISNYPNLTSITYDDQAKNVSISSVTFNGITVGGRFFTYFVVPNKPKFENPIMQGQQDTFSPKIFFSNVSDGDEYVVEVTYDLQDTAYTNNKVVYNIQKNLSQYSGIQEASFSLKTGSNFMYRVGNVKKIRNVFDVDQKIITFSDNLTGTTQSKGPELFVFVENDSPFLTTLPTLSTPPSITAQTSGSYLLNVSVSGSVVTGATIILEYPDDTIVTGITNNVGNITFSGLTFGTYTLTTEYRGYQTHVQEFLLDANKDLGYILEILWSNDYETWADKADDIIF